MTRKKQEWERIRSIAREAQDAALMARTAENEEELKRAVVNLRELSQLLVRRTFPATKKEQIL